MSPSSAGLPGWQSLRFSVTSPSLFLPCSLIFIISPHKAFLILKENSPTAPNWEQELPSLPDPTDGLAHARGSVLIISCYSRLHVFTSLRMRGESRRVPEPRHEHRGQAAQTTEHPQSCAS